MKIDLHTHSSASDGTQLPGEVIRSAAEAGLDVVALTDHDTTAGWEEAAEAAREHAVAFVPGTEVSCQTDDGISVHLLSYLQDPQDRALDEVMQRARRSRRTRAERMVEMIAEDYPISWEQVLDQVVGDATVGRPHLADALVAAGIAQTRSEAFSTVLHPRSGYYVGHYAPDPVTAVRLVRQAGGVPVMAHPLAGVRGRTVGQEVFDAMIEAGLAGLEIAHRDNPPEARAVLSQMAAEHDLIVTGSSDYHGSGKPNELGENLTSEQSLRRIMAEAGSGTQVVRP
ncbi:MULTISPECIES: PHP domain-containing protein [Kocuria]|uniref:PHP domain-containing protein n=1 Tax=Kocuria TaxID=57493 RepID=UPI0010F998B6|nr:MULTISPECIES: PHP domain-containing protein [Kocuria]MBM7823771.1 putative metal-dependent phosphoesterase TrpH [Kocuria palustris]MCT1590039.1 PHP domain-containing protein [Kocuria palustris]